MIDDQKFVTTLNRISRGHGESLPVLKGEEPSSTFLSGWARFLEKCVKEGLPLSDPRWQRVSVRDEGSHTRFLLEGDEESTQDPDFRVGLQLLMGILEGEEDEDK